MAIFPSARAALAGLVTLGLVMSGCEAEVGAEDTPSLEEAEAAPLGEALGSLLGTVVDSDDTCRLTSGLRPTCGAVDDGAPGLSYFWRAPAADTFTFSTSGSRFAPVLEVRREDGTSLGCSDESESDPGESSVRLALEAGQTVRIFVHGQGRSCGTFNLHIRAGSQVEAPDEPTGTGLEPDTAVAREDAAASVDTGSLLQAVDVALGKPASSITEYDASSVASFVTDGDPSTGWYSGYVRPYVYVEVDLQGFYAIQQFQLELGTTTGSAPANFEIQHYEQGCWKTVPETVVTGNPAGTLSRTLPLSTPLVTSRVRFVCTNKTHCRLRTFSVLGEPSTEARAPAPSCTAGTQSVRRSPSYDFLQFLPTQYNQAPLAKFPLIISLHGIGGTQLTADHTGMSASPEGLSRRLKNDTAFASTFPAIVVSPHCREIGVTSGNCWFSQDRLDRLWKDVLASYRIDPDRIYVTGLSGGGMRSIQFAVNHSTELAAVVPLCADTNSVPAAQKAFDTAGNPIPDADGRHICDLQGLPSWLRHGTGDTTVSYNGTLTFKNLMDVKCGAGPKKALMTLYAGAGHNVWDMTYNDNRLYTWLFAQRRGNASEPATFLEPTATTGPTVTITLPTSSATVTGGGTDPDGSISKWNWIALSRPSGAAAPTLTNASSSKMTASGLTTAGTYKFRLLVTDNHGVTDFADQTVLVRAAP
ncbi:discoidin domain-containing protein [Archangium violaceum]|uniref:PKD domain-containing protein n=1 Tax=Archangium violaceum TaxID=83451 RepID=UPI00193B3C3E|nr:discoidin domain-containing protein [Archangium violaceum]QRK11427.1 discoidin domain-containing protein [Archangium violaceum]